MILSNNKLLKLISLSIVFILAFTMVGCSENSPALGSFICVSAEYDGVSVDPSLVCGGDVVLELGENGWGTFYLGDEGGLINWSVEGSELKLVFNDKTYTGSCGGNTIELELPDSGLKMLFAADGSAFEKAKSREVQSYYGWWNIGDAGEQWQEYKGMSFDCCAVIEFDEGGNAEFIMWDEDSSYKSPLARVKVNIGEGNSVVADKGAFIDCEISESNLCFNTETQFEDLIIAELAYSDDRGVFNSVIYLRPWGTEWEDIQQDAPELMPYHYESWYLPLIEAGSQMPGEFELN